MISPEKEKQIRLLLKEELSSREIARRTGVNKGTVKAVSIRSGLRKYKGSPQKFIRVKKYKCRTCGGMVITRPCFLCSDSWPEIILGKSQVSNALANETSEMYRIIRDISDLHRLCLISHPLFRALARRAEESLRRILDGTKIA